MMITKVPAEITVCNLEVVLMPNGEVICNGQSLGWLKTLGAATNLQGLVITP